jgi:hypothetical protein
MYCWLDLMSTQNLRGLRKPYNIAMSELKGDAATPESNL